MAVNWEKVIIVSDEESANVITGKEILYLTTGGTPGQDGRGITSIAKTNTVGLVDTYTITYTDNTTGTFEVTNGRGITRIEKYKITGGSHEGYHYYIYYNDGTVYDFEVYDGNDGNDGADGRGIQSITLQSTDGLVKTYQILYTDNTATAFQVTDGQDALFDVLSEYPLNNGGQTDITNASGGLYNIVLRFGVEQGGSGTPSASNIRPFLPVAGVMLTVTSLTYSSISQTYDHYWSGSSIDLVYGGILDTRNGRLLYTHGHIVSYNGETINGVWWSDRDEYAPGTLPTIGAEVVYELDTPTEISIFSITWDMQVLNRGVRVMAYVYEPGPNPNIHAADTYTLSTSSAVNIETAIGSMIAPVFDSTQAYTAGDYVTYRGGLYKFVYDKTSGAWSDIYVEKTTLMDEWRLTQ